MRFSFCLSVIIVSVALLCVPSHALAKHRYFANIHPLTNYLQRCLGIGWSDGYHAPGAWQVNPDGHLYRQRPTVIYAGGPPQAMPAPLGPTETVPLPAERVVTPPRSGW